MTIPTAVDCFECYARLGWVIGSATLDWDNTAGKKRFRPHSAFGDDIVKTLIYDATGFCIYTGPKSDVCVIDLDDLERPEQQQLQMLMSGCNAVQRTRKGRHFLYRWDSRIRSTGSATHKVDTKSAGGCIICYPSSYNVPGQGTVEYIWERFPGEEGLGICPEAVIEFLTRLGLVDKQKSTKSSTRSTPSNPPPTEDTVAADMRLRPLLDQVPSIRWDSYNDWITIGMALFNEGCSVSLWDEYSQRHPKYVSGECQQKWTSFRKDADRKVNARRLTDWVDVIDDVYACENSLR